MTTTTIDQVAPPGCITVKEALSLTSGDYPGYTVEEAFGQMVLTYEQHLRECAELEPGWCNCDSHTSDIAAGGPDKYIESIAQSFRDEGWVQGSETINVDIAMGVLHNGHHRVLAAARAGLNYLPYHDSMADRPHWSF